MKVLVYIVIFVVVAAVIAGFFIVDSPVETRLKKFDEQRISDLSFIQGEIINFWTRKGELPKTLLDLKDDIRGFSIPMDPESVEQYGYKIKEKLEFSLCADFARETFVMTSKTNPVPYADFKGYKNDSWEHLRGYQCFSRVIDPELYPIR